jgi:hypothetical protein
VKKITVKGLAKATEEYIDAAARLQVETGGVSVSVETTKEFDRTRNKLELMLKQVEMEAKDGSTRRLSKKAH